MYGAHLYREGKAPLILCTAGINPADTGSAAAAEDMKAFCELIGISPSVIVLEDKARNTREHPIYCKPIFEERQIKKILLVTSASHMPRAVGVFRRLLPELEVIPAPTDFLCPEQAADSRVWMRFSQFIPGAKSLELTTVALHEYVGLAYYKLRGWL